MPIRKLAHPAKVRTSRRRPLAEGDVRIRSAGDVGASLRDLQLFLRATSGDGAAAGGGTLRKTRELRGSKEVAEKLGRISAKTIDRLAGAREARAAIKKKPESSVSSVAVSEDSGESSGRLGDQPGGQPQVDLYGALRAFDERPWATGWLASSTAHSSMAQLILTKEPGSSGRNTASSKPGCSGKRLEIADSGGRSQDVSRIWS